MNHTTKNYKSKYLLLKKGPKALSLIAVCYDNHYLFITYIVTSKPNLISVAAGFVHIVVLLLCCIFTKLRRSYAYIALFAIQSPTENHELQAKKNPAETGLIWYYLARNN